MASAVPSSLISKLRNLKVRTDEELENCNFCGRPIPADHRHMIDVTTRQFMCTCEMCVIVQSAHGHYKIIPQRYQHLKDLFLSEELWSEFMIPVNIAFFVFNSFQNGIVAYYPAAAGATESKLKMEAWKKLAELNPSIENLTPDVEALLVNRLDEPGYYVVPIDCCYKLIGMIRSSWKGISGGREVQDAIKKFFLELKNKTDA